MKGLHCVVHRIGLATGLEIVVPFPKVEFELAGIHVEFIGWNWAKVSSFFPAGVTLKQEKKERCKIYKQE